MKKVSMIQKIVDSIFGRKFYVCVVGMVGSGEYFVNSTIYRSLDDVERYKESLKNNSSFDFISCHSFRSHNNFKLTHGNTKRVD